MLSKKVTFENGDGHELAGRLELPDGKPPRAYALFAHCFTCTKNIKAATNLARALCMEGYGVLRFDFTGLGESEGEFSETNFSSNVADLVAAADFLREAYEAPALLVGHSFGGTAALRAARDVAECRAVCTIAAPADPAHITHLLEGKREEIERCGEAEVCLAGRPFRIQRQFLDDVEDRQWREHVRGLRRALLIMHSPQDRTVEIDNAAELFQTALHPKSFVTLDDADHLLSNEADSLYAGRVLAAWAGRYVGEAEDEEETTEDGEVVVRNESGFRTEVRAGRHALVADEPASAGGSDTGPTPYGLLSASLGACTAMTLRMYADHKKLPLESVRVSLRHEKVHGSDCAECESKDSKVDRIERVIEIEGNLDEEQRRRLLEIADKCPVHRTLTSETVVVSRLADGES